MIEYVLAILLCLGMAGVLEGGVKKGISKLWCTLAKDITGGCPNASGNGCEFAPELTGPGC